MLPVTIYVEAGFEMKKRTGAAFIGLSAACGTVWQQGLRLKLAQIFKCKKTLRMTGTRRFYICLGDDTGKTFTLKNGVQQGSFMAPTLFNVYLREMPETKSLKFGYADDWALLHQSKVLQKLETVLSTDLPTLKSYFDQWYLRQNTTKSSIWTTPQANQILEDNIDNKPFQHEPYPKYLGVTLDRTLTLQTHLSNVSKKLNSSTALIRKLAATKWDANKSVLKVSVLALCYSGAVYCAPIWERSADANSVDIQPRTAMRIISGALKVTQVQWLPTVGAIAPPHLRRKAATSIMHQRIESMNENIQLKKTVAHAPTTARLKSRWPSYNSEKQFDISSAWLEYWKNNPPTGGDIIENYTVPFSGFHSATRRQ